MEERGAPPPGSVCHCLHGPYVFQAGGLFTGVVESLPAVALDGGAHFDPGVAARKFSSQGGGLSFVTVLNQKSPSFPFPMVCGFWVQHNTHHNEGGVSMTNVV